MPPDSKAAKEGSYSLLYGIMKIVDNGMAAKEDFSDNEGAMIGNVAKAAEYANADIAGLMESMASLMALMPRENIRETSR